MFVFLSLTRGLLGLWGVLKSILAANSTLHSFLLYYWLVYLRDFSIPGGSPHLLVHEWCALLNYQPRGCRQSMGLSSGQTIPTVSILMNVHEPEKVLSLKIVTSTTTIWLMLQSTTMPPSRSPLTARAATNFAASCSTRAPSLVVPWVTVIAGAFRALRILFRLKVDRLSTTSEHSLERRAKSSSICTLRIPSSILLAVSTTLIAATFFSLTCLLHFMKNILCFVASDSCLNRACLFLEQL